jgi:hypothetical protein
MLVLYVWRRNGQTNSDIVNDDGDDDDDDDDELFYTYVKY